MAAHRPLTAAEKSHGRRLMAAVGVPADEIRETRTRLYWVDPATGEAAMDLAASELMAQLDDPDTLELAGEPCTVAVRDRMVYLTPGIEGQHGVAEVAAQLDAAGLKYQVEEPHDERKQNH